MSPPIEFPEHGRPQREQREGHRVPAAPRGASPSGPRQGQRSFPHHTRGGSVRTVPRCPDVGGLRARVDHPRPGRGRRRRTAPGAAHHRGHRPVAGHPGLLLPPGHRCLPGWRWRLRRVPGQPGRPHQPGRRRLARGRLHADGRRLHRCRCSRTSLGLPLACRCHRAAVPRHPPRHHRAQPARAGRDGPSLPAAHAGLHLRPARHHRRRPHPPPRPEREAARHVAAAHERTQGGHCLSHPARLLGRVQRAHRRRGDRQRGAAVPRATGRTGQADRDAARCPPRHHAPRPGGAREALAHRPPIGADRPQPDHGHGRRP